MENMKEEKIKYMEDEQERLYLIGVPEEERQYSEMMVENFPELIRDINPHFIRKHSESHA